jgi:hypothetical protein
MQRPVEMGNGSGTAAFTIVRLEPGEMPEGRIQILTHRTEATVWQPRWLTHRNGAQALLDLVIVVADESEAASRFARFVDRDVTPSAFGRMIALDRGAVVLVGASTFAAMLPEVRIPGLPFAGGYGLRVRSLAAAAAALRMGGIAPRQADGCLVAPFPHELGAGAWILVEDPIELPWRHSRAFSGITQSTSSRKV